ncbi:MAG: ABC transporter substrate-binding protein [Pseudomonadota bacterium]
MRLSLLSLLIVLGACSDSGWNNPYPSADSTKKILYSSFTERPKHLDPVSSYSENEARFTAQVYEPLVQYHYLKRPYELIPLTASKVPEPVFYDAEGRALANDADAQDVARSVYRITIGKGILFQPHPAFATSDAGQFHYHDLDVSDLETRAVLADFQHTGTRELKAADYVYQIKRLMHPRLHSPIAGLMSKYILGLKELGERLRTLDQESSEDAWLDLRTLDFPGARIIDDYTLEITITEKYPQFRYWLAMPFFAPVPWEADYFYSQPGMKERNITLDWYPVGTGPFMLTENNPNRRMILERNPNFRGESYPTQGEAGDREGGLLEDAGKTMPFIDSAYYSLEKEAIPAWQKFLQGYFDASGIVSDSFDQAVQFSLEGDAQLTDEMVAQDIQLATAVKTSILYMGFNMADEVVGGDAQAARLLRRAISIAVDYEEFISIFQNGRGIASQGPLPPGIFGHQHGEAGINHYVYDWVDGAPQRKSIENARALMREAGYPDGRNAATGEPLVLYFEAVSSGAGSKATFNWFRKQFDKLGIELVVRATDYNRFQEKIRKGTGQMFIWGWNADYPDPENFMFLLYGPNAKIDSQGENAVNFRNARFDELFVEMKSMTNGAERQQVIDEMVEILRRESPWAWGLHPTGYSLYHNWYGNSKPNLMARNTLKYKTIDPELRTQKQAQWSKPVLWPIVVALAFLAISLVPAIRAYRASQEAAAR